VLFGAVMLSASAGSTSGSIKLVRHVAIAKMLRREIRQTVHPDLVALPRLSGAVIDEGHAAGDHRVPLPLRRRLRRGVAIVIDSSLEGVRLTAFQSLTDSASVLGGAGPGLGFAGLMGSFEPFSDLSKLVLTGEMYLGRLEIVPMLVLFAGSYWRA
jgi:trk system potassium uptake protein TrkH